MSLNDSLLPAATSGRSSSRMHPASSAAAVSSSNVAAASSAMDDEKKEEDAARKPLLNGNGNASNGHHHSIQIPSQQQQQSASRSYGCADSSPPLSSASQGSRLDSLPHDPHAILLQSDLLVWAGVKPTGSNCTKLSRTELSIQTRDRTVRLAIEDVIGAERGEGKRAADSIVLHAYPRASSGCCCPTPGKEGSPRKYQRTTLSLQKDCNSPGLIDEWLSMLRKVLRAPWALSVADQPSTTARRIMFFINPKSGAGNAMKNLEKIRPMIEQWARSADEQSEGGGLSYTVLQTTHANHAMEVAASLDFTPSPANPSPPTDLVCISGDGLVHEVVNGLMSRKDWESIVRIVRVGHIGGGSGNGLSSAICKGSGEEISLAASTFLILKGFTRPFDLFVASQADESPRYGFLSMGYGMISDIDLESEAHRWMGNARFTYTAVAKVISGVRRYEAKLEYIATQEEPEEHLNPRPTPRNQRPQLARCASVQDGCEECGIAGPLHAQQRSDEGRKQLAQYLEQLSSKDASWASSRKVAGPAAAAADAAAEAAPSAAPAAASSSSSSGLSLDAPPAAAAVDAGWKPFTDQFSLLWLMNSTHAASDMLVAPTAHWSDGVMELYFVRSIPRGAVINLFLNLETGQHMSNEHIHRVRIKALRITPLDAKESQLTVDGERLPYKPVEVRVFRGVLNLLAR